MKHKLNHKDLLANTSLMHLFRIMFSVPWILSITLLACNAKLPNNSPDVSPKPSPGANKPGDRPFSIELWKSNLLKSCDAVHIFNEAPYNPSDVNLGIDTSILLAEQSSELVWKNSEIFGWVSNVEPLSGMSESVVDITQTINGETSKIKLEASRNGAQCIVKQNGTEVARVHLIATLSVSGVNASISELSIQPMSSVSSPSPLPNGRLAQVIDRSASLSLNTLLEASQTSVSRYVADQMGLPPELINKFIRFEPPSHGNWTLRSDVTAIWNAMNRSQLIASPASLANIYSGTTRTLPLSFHWRSSLWTGVQEGLRPIHLQAGLTFQLPREGATTESTIRIPIQWNEAMRIVPATPSYVQECIRVRGHALRNYEPESKILFPDPDFIRGPCLLFANEPDIHTHDGFWRSFLGSMFDGIPEEGVNLGSNWLNELSKFIPLLLDLLPDNPSTLAELIDPTHRSPWIQSLSGALQSAIVALQSGSIPNAEKLSFLRLQFLAHSHQAAYSLPELMDIATTVQRAFPLFPDSCRTWFLQASTGNRELVIPVSRWVQGWDAAWHDRVRALDSLLIEFELTLDRQIYFTQALQRLPTLVAFESKIAAIQAAKARLVGRSACTPVRNSFVRALTRVYETDPNDPARLDRTANKIEQCMIKNPRRQCDSLIETIINDPNTSQ